MERIFFCLDNLQESSARIAQRGRAELEMTLIRLCLKQSFQAAGVPAVSQPPPVVYAPQPSYQPQPSIQQPQQPQDYQAQHTQPSYTQPPPSYAEFSGSEHAEHDGHGNYAGEPEAKPVKYVPLSPFTAGETDTAQKPVTENNSGSNPAAPPAAKQVDEKKALNPADFKPLYQWEEIANVCHALSPALLGALGSSAAFVHGSMILVVTDSPLFMKLFKENEHRAILQEAVIKVMGHAYTIRVKNNAKPAESMSQNKPVPPPAPPSQPEPKQAAVGNVIEQKGQKENSPPIQERQEPQSEVRESKARDFAAKVKEAGVEVIETGRE